MSTPGLLETLAQTEPTNRGHLVNRVSLALLITDILALIGAAALGRSVEAGVVELGVLILTAFYLSGLYRTRLILSILDDLPSVGLSVFVATGLVTMISAATNSLDLGATVIAGIETLLLVTCGRAATYAAIRTARRRGLVSYRALIVGTGPKAARLGRAIDTHPETGLRVVGYVGPRPKGPPWVADQVKHENCRDLADVAAQEDASVILVTVSGVKRKDVLAGIRGRDPNRPCTLFLVPQFYELLHSPRTERIDKVPLIRLRSSMLARHKWRIKRVFDVLVASCGIVLTAPIMAAVALVIRLESGPGVLFRQQRVGKDGHLFTLLKFRSMRPATARESAERWSISGDARVGSVGRFLRKTSLDELPQLINVLRGDMSLVGPRPERPHFVERFGQEYDSYAMRHRVRPGLTGWAAINGLRGDTSIEDRAFFDNAYIDNWSLWLDVKVILRTFSAVAAARGE